MAEYPAVENGLPYDIVVEKIRFDEPEHEQPRKHPYGKPPALPSLLTAAITALPMMR